MEVQLQRLWLIDVLWQRRLFRMEESLQLCHQPQRPPEDRITLAANIIALNLRRQLVARVPIWPDSLSGINPVGYIHTAAQISKFSYSPPITCDKADVWLLLTSKNSPDAFGFMLQLHGHARKYFSEASNHNKVLYFQHLLYIWLHGSVSEQYVWYLTWIFRSTK